LLFIIKKKV